MIDQEKIVSAQTKVYAAIQEYQDLVNPGELVTDWVVVTQRSSIALEQLNRRALGVLCADGQSFITTRGMLEVALDLERVKN